MKAQINRIRRALAGENATSLESRMVKIQAGRMWAYGGQFCLSVPFPADFDYGFLPDPVLAFYAIPREGEVLTVQDFTLRIVAGSRSIKVPCVSANSIPVLDVLGGAVEGTLNMENLKRAAKFFDASDPFGQFSGLTLRPGIMAAGNGKMIFMGASGLQTREKVRIPQEAAETLIFLKQPTVAVFMDRQAIRFDLEDGTRLTSRLLVDGLPQSMDKVFADRGEEFEISEEAQKEITTMPCESWEFGGGAAIHRADDTTGIVTGATESNVEFKVSHLSLTTLLGLSRTLAISSRSLSVVGEDFAAVTAILRN